MDSQIFILYFCYDLIVLYFVAQIVLLWPLGALSVVSFWHTSIIVWLYFLLAYFLARQASPGPSSCSSPRISYFSKKPWFLLSNNGIETKFGLRCLSFHCSILRILCLLDTRPLLDMWFVTILSWSVACLFIRLTVFHIAKVLNFDEILFLCMSF